MLQFWTVDQESHQIWNVTEFYKILIEPKYDQKFRGSRYFVLMHIDVRDAYGFVVLECQICGLRNYGMCIIRAFCLLNVKYLYVTSNDLHTFIVQ